MRRGGESSAFRERECVVPRVPTVVKGLDVNQHERSFARRNTDLHPAASSAVRFESSQILLLARSD